MTHPGHCVRHLNSGGTKETLTPMLRQDITDNKEMVRWAQKITAWTYLSFVAVGRDYCCNYWVNT